jgi:hypothetical protein
MFEVSGRVRLQFEETVMNFWDLRVADGNGYLLMEGYGLYAILWKAGDNLLENFLKDFSKTEMGFSYKRGKYNWLLEEKDRIKVLNFEGEIRLPPAAPNGNLYRFTSSAGINVLAIEWEPGKPMIYQLKEVSVDELNLTQLRQPQPVSRKFCCQECNASLPVTLFPYTGSVVCPACYMQHSWEHGHGFVKRKKIDYRLEPAIPLASEGTIKGIPYRVTGYAEKEESTSSGIFWREFTLHNPKYGFAFLSEYNGHWIYLRQRLDAPVLVDHSNGEFELADESFIRYNSYRADLRAAEGEFPYDIFNHNSYQIDEYISPPEMWSREQEDGKGITWFYGEHISRHEIQQAFGVKEMPARSGIGAVQPTGYLSPNKMLAVWAIGLAILLIFHAVLMSGRQERRIFQAEHLFQDSALQYTIVTPAFELEKHFSNLEIKIEAPVANSWFELEATLVNTKTGKEFSQQKGVEYYFGYSDGERWSEGGTRDEILFNEVPEGSYLLQMQGTRPSGADAVRTFYVDVRYDVSNHANFALAKAIQQGIIESKRWGTDPISGIEKFFNNEN